MLGGALGPKTCLSVVVMSHFGEGFGGRETWEWLEAWLPHFYQWLMTHNHKLFYGGKGTVPGSHCVALAGLSHALKIALLVVI